MERGTVSSRVALLLRSAEVKPLFNRFVQQLLNLFSFLLHRFSRVGPEDLCKIGQGLDNQPTKAPSESGKELLGSRMWSSSKGTAKGFCDGVCKFCNQISKFCDLVSKILQSDK
jgi:hypothetical protein